MRPQNKIKVPGNEHDAGASVSEQCILSLVRQKLMTLCDR